MKNHVLRSLETKKYKPIIATTSELKDIKKAYEHMASNQQKGK